MRVKDIMTKGLRIAEPEEMLPHAARKMRTQNISALPVVEDRMLVGMVTDRDIVIRALGAGRDPAAVTVREIMTDECVWCSESDELEVAAGIMIETKVRRLPAMNDKNEIVGMLSLEDVARHAPVALTGEILKAVAHKRPPSKTA